MTFEEPGFEEEEANIPPFKVFVSHGRGTLWKAAADFIEKELEVETASLSEQTGRDLTDIESLDEESEDCCYAVVVLTAEDAGAKARENAAAEIGFFAGVFGPKNVLVLRQEGVEEFSSVAGIEYETFEGQNIAGAFERLSAELEDARADYEDDCED